MKQLLKIFLYFNLALNAGASTIETPPKELVVAVASAMKNTWNFIKSFTEDPSKRLACKAASCCLGVACISSGNPCGVAVGAALTLGSAKSAAKDIQVIMTPPRIQVCEIYRG